MISVTCAVIRNEDDEVLVVQRGEATDHPFKWEFPGGKLADNETEEECIIREVTEELSMEIVICGRLPEVEHDYGRKQIRLIPFICDTLSELPFLSEHLAFRWLVAAELMTVDFSEADISVAKSYMELSGPEKECGAKITTDPDQSSTDDIDLQTLVNNLMGMKEAEWVAVSAAENPAIFNKLIGFSFSSDKKLAFHSSWTLTKVCDKYPDMIFPALPGIIEALDKLDNESVQRSFLRIISLTEMDRISQKHHGILVDHCFRALRSGFSAIAIKAYSMEILYRLALIYPELANELSASVNLLQGEGSAGIVARGRMIMKKLAEMPINPKSSQQLS
jgi:8-oxo-dGTP diphosphatase